jgi:hypothetical protein
VVDHSGAPHKLTPVVIKRPVARPLDDPANPYRAEYSQWDRWAYARIADEPSDDLYEDQNGKRLSDPGVNRQFVTTFKVELPLDDQGFIVPLNRIWKEEAERMFNANASDSKNSWQHPEDYPWGSQQRRSVTAYARPSQADGFNQAHQRALLQYYPAIPPALTASPVENVVALPDGTFCIHGGLGGYDPQGGIFDHGSPTGPEAWFRYDASGKELGRVEDKVVNRFSPRGWPGQWVALTFPGYLRLLEQTQLAQHYVEAVDGYTLVWDNTGLEGHTLEELVPAGIKLDPGEVGIPIIKRIPMHLLAAYDWDGTPLPLNKPLTRPRGYCIEMPWALVSAGTAGD